VFNDGALTIARSTLTGNRGGGSGEYGSAIWNRGSLVLRDSTVVRNEADAYGTAFFNEASATVINSTIASNHSEYGCGGISNGGTASLTLVHSTIASNWSDEFSCGFGNAGELRIKNSIALGIAGPITAKLASIVAVAAGTPLLDPAGPADNGGPTETWALTASPTNPALGKADAATCAGAPVNSLDQRGLPRLAPCDIGAYELQP
jgi:hypothetical protein